MNRCCIIQCESNKLSPDKKTIYFNFPLEDQNLLQKWTAQIGRKDWKPKEDDTICAMHFSSTDIETEAGKDPKLKAGVVPTIFPSYKISPGLQMPFTSENNTDVKLISFQGTAPVILTPQLVKRLPRIISGQRYRKILPKVDQSAELPNKTPVPVQNTPNVANPCLILIPFDTNTPVANNSPVVANNLVSNAAVPDKKKLMLKIQVDRRYTRGQYLSEFSQSKSEGDRTNEETNEEEVVVDNVALNRRVRFSLDPVTGEIKVSKSAISSETEEPQETLKKFNDEVKSNSLNNGVKNSSEETHAVNGFKHVINNKPLSLNELKQINNKSNQSSSSDKSISTEQSLQERYTKAQKNFNVLRRRVRILRQTRKREMDQVEKLQNQLDHLKSDQSRVPTNHDEELCNKRLKPLPENESMLNNEVLIIKLPPQFPQASTDVASPRSNESIVKHNNIDLRTSAPGILNNREAAEKTISHGFMEIN